MMYPIITINDTAISKEIVKSKSQEKHKTLGRKVEKFDKEILEVNYRNITHKGNITKFTQGTNRLNFLFNNQNKTLAEASPVNVI